MSTPTIFRIDFLESLYVDDGAVRLFPLEDLSPKISHPFLDGFFGHLLHEQLAEPWQDVLREVRFHGRQRAWLALGPRPMEALAPHHTLFQRLNRFRMLSASEMRLRVHACAVDDLRSLASGFRLRQSALANGRAYRP